MFHWICPECGREIPPSVRECQACDPTAVASTGVEPITEVQTAEVEAAITPPAIPPAAPPLLLLAAAPEPIPEAPAAPAVPLEPVLETPPAIEAVASIQPEPEAPSAQAASVEPVVEIAIPAAPPEDPIKLQDVPDPLLALAEEIRAAQAARAVALSTPPAPPGLLELAEAVGVQEPKQEPVVLPEPVSEPADLFSITQKFPVPDLAAAPAEAVTALALLAPPEPRVFHELRPTAPAPEPEPTPQPAALAPEARAEGPMLPLAPMQDYKPATSRSIQPVPPKPHILAADPGPRITLPGPTLPPELSRLQEANVVTVIGEDTAERVKEAIPPKKSAAAPGWMVSAVVMLLLLAAGLGIVFYLLPHTVADAKPAPTPAVAATAPAPTGGTSPIAKLIEVTGFRIVTSSDPNKKSEVQYIVVNHSDADISDANVFITLRSAKPGQPPICRFSFKVPSLSAFESKEMSSPIEKAARAISLPDWQDFRADVQISQ